MWLWNRLVELGARPAGLGARDTLRMEASFPLYGHEMGTAPDGTEIPIFAVPLAKFAVSFSAQKGDFIGRAALERQHRAFVPSAAYFISVCCCRWRRWSREATSIRLYSPWPREFWCSFSICVPIIVPPSL